MEARPYDVWGGGRVEYLVVRCPTPRRTWRVKPASTVDRRTAHRGRCALRRVGNVSALQIRRPLSNGRGVGDAAPYGCQLNVGIRIVVNRCANTANFRPPLGSPERGAVAAQSAVTEGLRITWVGCATLSVNPRREGVEALPYGGVGRASAINPRRPLTERGASGTLPLTGGLYTSR